MSKLDEILETAHKEGRRRPEGYDQPLNDGKEEIKALMLELIGEPETTYKYDVPDKTHQIVQKNLWKQELRQKVAEL